MSQIALNYTGPQIDIAIDAWMNNKQYTLASYTVLRADFNDSDNINNTIGCKAAISQREVRST